MGKNSSLRRLGPVQLAIMDLVMRGVREFDEIVKTLSSLSIPKSSIYTAVDELRKKNIIRVATAPNGRRFIELKDEVLNINDIISVKQEVISRLVKILLLLTTSPAKRFIKYSELEKYMDKHRQVGIDYSNVPYLYSVYIYSMLDPVSLEEYKKSLEVELEMVKKALKRWKKVSVE